MRLYAVPPSPSDLFAVTGRRVGKAFVLQTLYLLHG